MNLSLYHLKIGICTKAKIGLRGNDRSFDRRGMILLLGDGTVGLDEMVATRIHRSHPRGLELGEGRDTSAFEIVVVRPRLEAQEESRLV